ncbi:uncharacterized protein Mbs isoform X2 [Lepeophtheirus salmonis]|uniref:uncharacterized protein Mbs isoform X2 n=2 Tax=Lepeophtheirus salmonis TaxID=72036 RepID=UPI003AF3B5B4
MSIETRSNSALLKRAEQLKRWQESDTCRRSGEHRSTIKAKVQFTDGCVFLAACAASDKEEVRRLLARGADIDTANVDGLTALHQACIDDNLEMVEFLVERGADVNRGDNEGWTPLHATASCGFLSIAKYLLEHKCNVAAVNNDGELAIDISESDEMEELLQNEIDTRSIDCDASRVVEECMMFEDATKWVESDKFGDVPHQKTGATSLHVAAAKGYIKVIGLLLECNAPINIQDYDGWTPLHAAAHWSQREAIDLLCKNHADMDIKNYVGQTCFDVADPDVLKFLEDLKRKQASMQKDRPDFRNLANRPSTTTTSSLAHSGGRRRSSITRLSIDDKELRLKKDSSYERDSLRGSSLVSETIQESNKSNAESDSDVGRKNRANLSDNNSLPKITLSKDDSSNKVPGYSPPHPAESDKKKPISSSPSESSDDVHPWRRPVSLRSRPVSSTLNSKKDDSSDSEVPLRRIHSFESDEKFYTRLTELREKIRSNHTSSEAASSSSSSNISNPSSTSNEQTPPYRSTTTTTSTNSSSSYRYLNTTPCSSSSSSTTNFSSLPRTYGYHRNLPSLPECSKYSPTNAGSSGSLIRSSSLRDNSVAYTPVPFRQSTQEDESPPSTSQLNTLNNNNIDNNILNDNNNNNQNNSNNFNNHNNNKNNTRLQRRHQNMSTDDDDVSSSKSHTSSSTETPALISDKKINDFTSPHSRPTTLSVGRSLLWKRYEPDGGNRVKSDSSLANNSLSSKHQPPQSHVRSVVDEKMNSSVPSTKEDDHPSMNDKSTLGSVFKNFFKSFVPPVRDEESETQRKAHAKRVRETRRSTQGVTLEDLKSAEQLVKKKQQQENQIRTSELQQLAAAASGGVGSTATTTVTTSATLVTSGGSSPASTPSSTSSAYDRKPSWRLRSSEGANDRNRFRLEDAGPSETLNALRKSSKIEGKGPPPLPSSDPPPLSSPGSKDGGTSVLSSSITTPTGTQKVIQRRKKPKRRSTGVVHLDIGDLDNEEEGDESETEDEMEAAPSLTLASLEREVNGLQVAAEEDEKLIVLRKDDLNSLLTAKPTLLIGKELNLSGDAKTSSFGGGASGNNPSSSSNNKYLHPNNAHQPTSGYHNKSMEKDSHNGGDIDYKKLWEESQLDNSRLRDELSKSEDTRGRLEGALHSASKPQMSETEKREKRALEKKLSEMEEELKQLQKFKAENERLKSENRALSRVVSKLTSSPAAATSSPSTKSSSALSKSSYGNF